MSEEPQCRAMSKRGLAAVLLVGVLLAEPVSAKRLPLPPPNPERGSIGITIRSLAPIKIFRSSAAQVFFVRVEEGVDPFDADAFLPSNYAKGRQVFLLNVRPGRYLAVAADLRAAPGSGLDMKAFFSEKLIPLTEVTVAAGEVVFAGDFLVATHLDMKDADRAQTHYYGLISPEMAGRTYMGRAFSGEGAYRAELESAAKDSGTEREFWNEVQTKVLTTQEWRAVIEKRLAAPTPQREPTQATPEPTPQVSPEPTPQAADGR